MSNLLSKAFIVSAVAVFAIGSALAAQTKKNHTAHTMMHHHKMHHHMMHKMHRHMTRHHKMGHHSMRHHTKNHVVHHMGHMKSKM